MNSLPASPLVRAWIRAACASTLAFGVMAGPAQAQWMWRDASGRVTASDMPPPAGTAQKDILRRPAALRAPAVLAAEPEASEAAASAASAAAKAPVDPQLEARRKTAEEAQAAKTRADEQRLAQQRAENCRAARNQLAVLESGQPLARATANGQTQILDDNGRAAEVRRARQVIASDCRRG